MRIEKDYKELLELFNKHKVRFCIVGAFAMAFHNKPRYTKDIDLLVEPSLKNAEKIISALNDFGFGELKLTIEDFTKPHNIVQLGYEPVRIDILTSVSGLHLEPFGKTANAGSMMTAK